MTDKVGPPPGFKMPRVRIPSDRWDYVNPTFKNEYWNIKTGGMPKFKTPNDLWKVACEYFTWVQSTPLYEYKSYSYMGDVHQDKVPKMRAMTQNGFQLHAGISDTTWYNYKAKKAFAEMIGIIEKVIYSQKFEGAAAGLLNPVIIARELGLKESTENTNVNAELKYQDLTDEQLDARLKALLHAEGIRMQGLVWF